MKKIGTQKCLGILAALCLSAPLTLAQSSTPSTSSRPSKPAATAAKGNTSPATVEYKDPEDMQTRYRPGNNKTGVVGAPTTAQGTSGTGTTAAGAEARKHVANIKWQDRQMTTPTCDGALKNTVKCESSPPVAGGASTAATSGGAEPKH